MSLSRRAFTLVELLVVIAVIGILIAVLLPAINAARESARRGQCVSNLRQVGIAVQSYHEQNQKYPMGLQMKENGTGQLGKEPFPGTTALVAILPFIEEKAVYDLYDFKIGNQAPASQGAVTRGIPIFRCPSGDSERIGTYKNSLKFARSNYAVCFGSNKMWSSSTSAETDGMFRADGQRRNGDLVDGTSKTVVASEVLTGKDDNFDDNSKWDARGLWAFHQAGSAVYTHFNSPNSLSADVLHSGQCVSAPKLPCSATGSGTDYSTDHAAARSTHAGGVVVVFADNHVTFILDNIDPVVWKAMATIEGSEAVDIQQ
jgi:prepilin-type N-terminal cleavage/methylation domain-containing protein